MSYVLVHLVGDTATEHAGRLSIHLQEARPPARVFEEPSPDHRDVGTAVALKDSPLDAVCIGHGGPAGLGPTPEAHWADARQLGSTFKDARVYAYACSTAGDLDSLGARAVDAGVAVFVGHDRPIQAPLAEQEQQMIAQVAGAAILTFLDGQDDPRALRQAIYDAGDEYLKDEIDLVYVSGSNSWEQSWLFDKLATSLHVHRRSPPPP